MTRVRVRACNPRCGAGIREGLHRGAGYTSVTDGYDKIGTEHAPRHAALQERLVRTCTLPLTTMGPWVHHRAAKKIFPDKTQAKTNWGFVISPSVSALILSPATSVSRYPFPSTASAESFSWPAWGSCDYEHFTAGSLSTCTHTSQR